jgi:hypothetical protein
MIPSNNTDLQEKNSKYFTAGKVSGIRRQETGNRSVTGGVAAGVTKPRQA